ncbi:SUKH-4 family immunity protein [Streptomyces sp. H27-D2]|uniref:SUKH-4 family immunity protein n=1 Tax=Streptomyces sp. H27-D2 TaxID=3046304 RepID=UPI002DBE5B5A|nr:SUKH-4 family immunity protein [Streptomyces sp. H27-D2]MEC4018292.1 SUKH-4 family immunity protein [Streptomyces sp. H27-D2]
MASFQYMIIALDPENGKVYSFPEGSPLESYELLHRDVESLVYTVLALWDFTKASDSDVDLEELEIQFKGKISSFDRIPFSNEGSQWARIIEEIVEASWSA